ncbi:MAG: tripartite tricarboxylate transporter substrate binding protein [Alphaproteobacteria bacterium]
MLTTINRRAVVAVLAGVGVLAVAGGAIAESYPDKPITFVVPWPAGGRTDIVGRIVASSIGSVLGQPVAVVNRTGGRGAVGTKFVLDAPKDGYTVLVTTPGNQILGPVHNPDIGFKPMDFRGIGRVASGAVVLAAGADQPFKTAKEMLDYAKAHPGELSYSGVKNVLPWLAAESLAKNAGVSFKHVPSKGDADAVPMALGGHVNMVSSSSVNAIAPHLGGGKITPLVVFADERLAELPDTPTAKELGYDITASPWTGLAVAKGVPEDRIEILRKALKQVIEDKTFLNFASQSKTLVSYADGAAFEQQWASEYGNFSAVVGK